MDPLTVLCPDSACPTRRRACRGNTVQVTARTNAANATLVTTHLNCVCDDSEEVPANRGSTVEEVRRLARHWRLFRVGATYVWACRDDGSDRTSGADVTLAPEHRHYAIRRGR